MSALAGKIIRICRELALFSEEPGRTTRTFLSPPMRDVHRVLGSWMAELGMRVRVDAAGNLRGLHGGGRKPRLLVGSHLDTVPNAGPFDGVLGVVMGIALVEAGAGMAVEVVGFSEEEGVRFGMPFIGSRALAGTLEVTEEIAAAIRAFGLDPAALPAARMASATVAYLEFHIEQGPVLESMDLPVAVVDAIVGQSRWLLTFDGKANHAGTTPMPLRRDALAAAAEWVGEVEACARRTNGLVATVGSLTVSPNAANVIPGEVRASLDVRHADDAVRRVSASDLLAKARTICDTRGIRLGCDLRLDQNAVALDSGLFSHEELHHMASGAGHDAMILAPHVPSAMVFLRSPGGISHHPEEAVIESDVDAALGVGARFMRQMERRYV